jgi:hypothetical protein
MILVTGAGNECAGERVVNQTVLDPKLLVKQFKLVLEFFNLVKSPIQRDFFLYAVIVQIMPVDCQKFVGR